MALIPLYGVGGRIAGWFGGSVFDGIRLIHATAVGVACALVAWSARRLALGALESALLAAAFLATQDVLGLVRVAEDDCVSLAWMAGILSFCVTAAERLTPRRAVLGGALLAGGVLTNYPVIVWAPVMLLAVSCYSRVGRRVLDPWRLISPALVVCGFVATIGAWGAWIVMVDHSWSWRRYWQMISMAPNELAHRTGSLDALLGYVAVRPLAVVIPGYPPAWVVGHDRQVAWILIALAVVGAVAPVARGLQRCSSAARMASLACVALLVCTFPAAWKNDHEHFERMNHVPLCGVALLGALLAPSQNARPRGRWVRRAAAASMLLLTLYWGIENIARTPRHASWLAQFGELRRRSPDIDTFVLAESEFSEGGYDKRVSAALALPHPIMLSPDDAARRWRLRTMRILSVAELRALPPMPMVLTSHAQQLLR
jgi:hypothetical protein